MIKIMSINDKTLLNNTISFQNFVSLLRFLYVGNLISIVKSIYFLITKK